MADALVLKSATDFALKYEFTSDASGTGAVVTQANLVAAAAGASSGPSPLLALLQGVTDDTVWGNLTTGGQVSVYATPRTQGATAAPLAAELAVVGGPGRVLRVSSGAIIVVAEIEVRLHHTFDR